MTHIKAIIWDFGNVLARFDHLKTCRGLAKYSPLSPEEIYKTLFKGEGAPATRFEIGQFIAKDFFQEIQKVAHLKRELPFLEMSAIWQDIFEENAGVSKVISRVRPDVRHCICSNTDPIHWLAIERLPVIETHFSTRRMLVLSYRMKARKPDIAMYREALACLGLDLGDAAHALYIEDIAEYRTAFEALGGNTLAYDCSKDPLSVLEDGLRSFGVLAR